MDKLKKWIRGILLAIAGAFVAYVAYRISRQIGSRRGKVSVSDSVPWKAIPGRDDIILVEDGPRHYAHVELPLTVRPDDVKAVALKEHSAVVEVKHNATDRRSRSRIDNSALDQLGNG